MKKSFILAAAVAFVLFSVSYSYGEDSIIAFDNLSPTEPYYSNGGAWFGTRPINPDLTTVHANGFTPSTSGYLEELWLGMTSHASNNDLTLSLYSDSNGGLGTQLWQQRFTGAITGAQFDTLTHVSGLTTTNSPLLMQGHSYWLTAEAPDDGETFHSWWSSNTGDLGPWGRANNDVWQYDPSHWRYAMRVGLTPIPEPGTLSLMLGAFAFACRRRGLWAGKATNGERV